MSDETKGAKVKAEAKPSPAAAPVEESRYERAEHLSNARAMHGVSAPLVAAAMAVLGAKDEGYTKSEVQAAVARVSKAKINGDS